MIKVLIADDEPEFRQYMVELVDWASYGFEICGQARTGVEAVELAALTIPQIALLDINMPAMDGIAAAEIMKAQNSDICIALVTGYSEFEYARRAIKLGVEDYVLKPFRKDELLAAMLKFKLMIQKKEEDATQAKDDAFFAKERLLNALITDGFETMEEEFLRFFHKLGVSVDAEYYVVASIEIDQLFQKWLKPHDISLWRFAVSNVLGDLDAPSAKHLIFNGPEGRIISIHCLDSQEEVDALNLHAYQLLIDYAKKYFRFSVTIGISSPAGHLREIRNAYFETAIALQNKLTSGVGKLIEYRHLNETGKGFGYYPLKLNEQVLSALRRNELDEVNGALLQIKAFISTNPTSVDLTYAMIMNLISLCLSHITELGGDIVAILGEDFKPFQHIKKVTSLDESFTWISLIFTKTIQHYSVQKMSRMGKIVKDAQSYIEENYADADLGVEQIAQHFHLDSSYIRKAFAKELTINVTEYMTQFRMKQAKQLMDTVDMKLQELSERVGYTDAGYFSKVFKKHFGLSPSEYLGRKDTADK
ncbi:hypothetical protein A8709_15585 [Paenibacillus pectinilyticus]|uniref:DNA-binding response regulator n=1 Tax=Paenibacillus pectinilyticus TaxID=512399 RepID=A0A1C1A4N4_9BACL|nr:response regulator [Paenibacillus pectinilyticus]OCT15496.1 hypothetical protein A8709_15585 [Paenibacillus pectinilyticus]